MRARFWVAGLGLVLLAAGWLLVREHFCDSCRAGAEARARANAELAEELALIARESDGVALRGWLKARQPEQAMPILLALDNGNDPGSKARLSVLRSIHELGSDGLTPKQVSDWAKTLRVLAGRMLRDSRERTEFLALSFQMEGRLAEAEALRVPNRALASPESREVREPKLRLPTAKFWP